MKNEKMLKEIVIQVVTALLIQMILYGAVYFLAIFNKEKLNITICTSTKNNNGYTTSINIKNYQNDKSINSIIIWNDANIDINGLNYKDIEKIDDRIIIKNIPPSYDGTLIVNSKDKIDEKNTRFETEENKTVNFLYSQEQEVSKYWKQVLLYIVIYIIVYAIMAIIINVFTKKHLEIYRREIEQMKIENENIKDINDKIDKELLERKREIKDVYKGTLKNKLFLHRRLVDYAKELDFYRGLIKSIVKKYDNNKDICYEITKELKTYKTLDKVNLKDLEIDSLKISEIEEKEIQEELNNYKK